MPIYLGQSDIPDQALTTTCPKMLPLLASTKRERGNAEAPWLDAANLFWLQLIPAH